ncbi:ABC transporter ATP-binding protein [Azospirillum doebereinerae]|uniref:Spermidine/putrescine import ATP-binding protein PotA n=1 Tax=Azospirillum doebereinerae TaxID=92933 RepID=A0A433J0L1_9PROT|nr:ABC transporter ATP-binding protein [Azospirillum doebereinerae]MCG5240641.1 ABC transporter ATP-binding protein [Azospirillum doebereinerae]RUQ62738.1 ABC transporter ATP-binding protein [Azospirillum doebereinerae]
MNHQFSPAALAAQIQSVGVDIEGVNLSYGSNHVLKDVNLAIKPGEFFAFLGPSGCGKTTLLRLIAGFNTAQRGEVRIGGRDISVLPPHRRDVGMVFQSYALWPHMTVRRNVAFGLEERRVPRAEIERRVDAALDLVGLRHLADRRPSQLSGGQQQRVALARTIVIEPKVLLLDEPLSNLDAKLRVQMRQELLSLQRKLGLTTIFVTHDQEEANTICDRIAVMEDGKVQQVGTPQDLYDHPANLFVAGFLGTANVLDGAVRDDGAGRRVFVGSGVTPVALPPSAGADAAGKLMFRPQNLIIRPDGGPPAPGHARLTGTIRHREFLGASIRYAVDVGGQLVQVDAPHQAGDALLAPDAPIVLDLAADKARLLRP